METSESQRITELLAGMQLAIVHLSRTLALKANMDMDEMADSFIETAVQLPLEVHGRDNVQRVLRQIAAGIRTS